MWRDDGVGYSRVSLPDLETTVHTPLRNLPPRLFLPPPMQLWFWDRSGLLRPFPDRESCTRFCPAIHWGYETRFDALPWLCQVIVPRFSCFPFFADESGNGAVGE